MEQPSISRTPATMMKPVTLTCYRCTAADILAAILPTDLWVTVLNFKGSQFPMLPDTVQRIYIGESPQLTGIEGFPSSLRDLSIRGSPSLNVQTLPPYPPTLLTLTVTDCGLTEVPPLPASLTWIDFSRNRITSLPLQWPPNLIFISFYSNKIREIHSFPPRLERADFNNNQIKRIPQINTIGAPEIDLNANPLVEPFASIYGEYRLRMDDDENEANLFLKTTVNNYYAKQAGMQRRQQNIRGSAAKTLGLKYSGLSNTLGRNMVADIASLVSGKEGSLNQQLEKLYQQIPEKQPVGITQQPFIPPHLQREQNEETRYRLKLLLQEEQNIARKRLGGKRKSHGRKTRRTKRKN